MNRVRMVCRCLALGVFLFLAVECLPTGLGATAEAAPSLGHPYTKSFAELPLAFEPDRGQTSRGVRFLARGNGQTLFLGDQEAILVLGRGAVLHLEWLGARSAAKVSGEARLPGVSNYFLGRDPARWHTNIPQFGRVKVSGIYPGIDLVYYGKRRQLEYDLVLSPGADLRQVRLGIRGAGQIRISPGGDLVLSVPGGEMIQKKPLVYQMDGQKRQQVEGHYVLRGTDEVAFAVASYDVRQPLVIDPVLVYSTYLGGSASDSATAIAVDGNGNAYVTGSTASSDFPTVGNPPLQSTLSNTQDAFVAKLSADGSTLLYSTYLGGAKGQQGATAIAIDTSGAAYVAGYTSSSDFPVTHGAFQTAAPSYYGTTVGFVSKLGPSGSVLSYSTFIGQGSGGNNTYVNGIAVDSAKCAYVAGKTYDSSLPTSATAVQPSYGGQADAFVIKLNAAGSGEIYGTFLGGSQTDKALGIAVDSSGNAYIAGNTTSFDFPLHNAVQTIAPYSPSGDGFVAKLNGDASALVYSTYLSGVGGSSANAIAVDGNGNAYVTGRNMLQVNLAADFPLKDALQPTMAGGNDAFLTKFDPTGALVYSTYLGGSSDDSGLAVGVDSAGDAYVAGTTSSPDFPLAGGLPSHMLGPFWPVFKTTDGGNIWTFGTAGGDTGLVSALAVDPETPSTLYSGTPSGRLYKSVDWGAHWARSDTGLPGYQINTIAVAPNNSLIVYAGTALSGVYRSFDGGASWSYAGLSGYYINALAVDPGNSSQVYCAIGNPSTAGGAIYMSNNAGASWTSIIDSMNASMFTSVVVDPTSPQHVYVGDYALAYTLNDFQSWSYFKLLAVVNGINGVAIDPAAGNLYLAVNGGANGCYVRLYTVKTNLSGCANGTSFCYSDYCDGNGAGLSVAVSGTGTVFVGTPNIIQGAASVPAAYSGPFNIIAADPSAGNTLYVGASSSSQYDAFLAVVNPTGTAILFSTFFGGSQADTAQALAVDNNGHVWLAGATSSPDLPTAPGVKQPSLAGGQDAFIAKFTLPVPITFTTSPSGLSFTVDGTTYTSPQTLAWAPGDTHTIAVTSPQSNAGTRYAFVSWNDGGALSHTVTAPSAGATYTANFSATQYLLTLNVSPSGGGTISANPASPDGYYDANSSVELTAAPAWGYQFTGWTSGLNGTTNPQNLAIAAPATVAAGFLFNPPVLSIAKGHTGSFKQGQNNVTYLVTVSNGSTAGPTSGPVTVTETVPSGLTFGSMTGKDWSCSAVNFTCSRTDALGPGQSYPQITVTLSVAKDAQASLSNQAGVTNGSASASASDPTAIILFSPCDVNRDWSTDVSDVQSILNEALGVAAAVSDLNHDGMVSVIEVQLVLDAAMGLGCSGS